MPELDLTVVLADVFRLPVDEITNDLALGELDVWDSLKHIELVASLEEAYGIELSVDDIVAMRSVALIRLVIACRVQAAAQ